jgi:hypothetical protein
MAPSTAPQKTVYLADNTAVTLDVDNKSFRILTNSTSVDKIIALSDGLADGQHLTILVRNSGSGKINFVDNPVTNNTDLSSVAGAFSMGNDDILSFIWDAGAGYWVETGRSDN